MDVSRVTSGGLLYLSELGSSMWIPRHTSLVGVHEGTLRHSASAQQGPAIVSGVQSPVQFPGLGAVVCGGVGKDRMLGAPFAFSILVSPAKWRCWGSPTEKVWGILESPGQLLFLFFQRSPGSEWTTVLVSVVDLTVGLESTGQEARWFAPYIS